MTCPRSSVFLGLQPRSLFTYRWNSALGKDQGPAQAGHLWALQQDWIPQGRSARTTTRGERKKEEGRGPGQEKGEKDARKKGLWGIECGREGSIM